METLNFKTNIKCGGCIAAVTPYLNAIEQLDGWNVDTANPDKILTVQTTDNRIGEVVKKAIEKAGYKAEPIARP
ncbi:MULTISPECIES: heavy-metal-associated domain-containing protein [Spirosomataceae]|jgi:copper chaperone|uniref:Heavy-metal-associated domain-containing protein n=1 Tax=Fibrivirga algicola TaxID=2950420 RepID=A0ABX0QM65_9BACT|nr:heavy-metal-associated domain-containing protein [Fibrivirga algicola]NID13550.1 heavy-metal-associated domain-containing protein [Fibrivirga algicola]